MTSDLLSSFLVTMLATVFVIALAYVFLRLLRRYQVGRAAGADDEDAIEFVRSLAVGSRERVTVVRFRGETMMLGVTAGGISCLARWDRKGAAAGPRPQPPEERPLPEVR